MSNSVGARVWGPLATVWVVWGTTYLGTSAMVQTMPPLVGAGSRYLLGGLFVALIVVVTRGPRALVLVRAQVSSTAIAGLGIIGVWGVIVALSLRHIPGGIAALIAASVPLWVVVLRRAAGEIIGWRTGVGVVVGIAGIGAMLLPGGIEPVAGSDAATVVLWSLAMVGASISWAVFSFGSRRLDLPRDALVATAYELIWCGGAIAVIGMAVGERPHWAEVSTASLMGWGWLVVAAVIGYTAYTYLLPRAPLSLLSTFAFVNPVVAVVLGWLFLAEPFSRSVIIGLTVVVTGTALVVWGENGPPQHKGPTRIAGGAFGDRGVTAA